MCKWGKTRPVLVKIPADLSATGFDKFQYEQIDECIAPIIQALQQGGIDMRGSCCGHDASARGYISLQDGRMLIIVSKKETDEIRKTDGVSLHVLRKVWNDTKKPAILESDDERWHRKWKEVMG